MKLFYKLQYTLYWLRYGRPVAYGEPFTVPANWRARRRVLKDARIIYKMRNRNYLRKRNG